MTSSSQFSEEHKRECCLMISMGCDRETACNYLGKSAEQLRQQLQQDPEFRKRILRAEATPEFNHMKNLFSAAKEEKNWRASVWWLERRSPERYARRAPDAVSAAQLRQIIEELAEAIVGGVGHQEDRQRLLARLRQIAQKMQGEIFEDVDPASSNANEEEAAAEQDFDSGIQE